MAIMITIRLKEGQDLEVVNLNQNIHQRVNEMINHHLLAIIPCRPIIMVADLEVDRQYVVITNTRTVDRQKMAIIINTLGKFKSKSLT